VTALASVPPQEGLLLHEKFHTGSCRSPQNLLPLLPQETDRKPQPYLFVFLERSVVCSFVSLFFAEGKILVGLVSLIPLALVPVFGLLKLWNF